MPGRGSIARLMIATALLGLDLALIRSWIAPAKVVWVERIDHVDRPVRSGGNEVLGEFGPIMFLGLIGLAVAIASGGRPRWSCLGATAALSLTSTVLFLAPTSFRHAVFEMAVLPIEQSLPRSMRLGDERLWADAVGMHYRSGLVRCPFLTVEDQISLAVAQLPSALIVGLLAAAFRGRQGVKVADLKPPGRP